MFDAGLAPLFLDGDRREVAVRECFRDPPTAVAKARSGGTELVVEAAAAALGSDDRADGDGTDAEVSPLVRPEPLRCLIQREQVTSNTWVNASPTGPIPSVQATGVQG